MDRPTRHEQAQAILHRKGRALASRVLGRRATNAADFSEAFNLEWIDLIAAIENEADLLALGRNVVGPRDGLYVLADADGTFRVYIQERGNVLDPVQGDFETARDAAIDRVIILDGLPWVPPGR